ncbi:cytochrome P450 [Mycena rosella]|uniref:Cytochrome P450 n=1 Tax=Mycena rosella TaxID=1033263 RepID=A0AAD7FVP0_MYCRO|nr:cytochrome P450 [Mycena rosella]
MLLRLIVSSALTLGAYVFYRAIKTVYAELTSPLRHLPGPKSTHRLLGNILDLRNGGSSGLEDRWVQQYGRTMKVHVLFGAAALYSMDIKAVHHILFNTQIYQKPASMRFNLGRIVGPGILVVEGDVHKQQRKIMNPAFGAPQIRELTGIFVEKSIQLRDIWAAQAAQNGGIVRVEVFSWLSKATLDIIGLAGFNYKINALGARSEDEPNELAAAFETLFVINNGLDPLRALQGRFPIFRHISTKSKMVTRDAQATMMRIGRKLLADSKRDIAETGTFETGRARDLLNLLVRANTSKEIPEHQRLSDEDVLAQVPTFLVAGHETTSTAMTWALFALTQNKAAQTRLRTELQSVETENPTLDELNGLRYLDCVVRETLRVHSPVPSTLRVSLCDDIVPLANPFTDAQGTVHESIRVPKGTQVFIPISTMNRDPEIWGPDSNDFVPERWESPISSSVPGIWGNMMTFFGGPRSCIGYRFSLAEMKALLFTLIRDLEFELAVPISDVGKKSTSVTQAPVLNSDLKAGNQLPLLVRQVVRSS